ncbi:MAG: diguanylate cyclase [Spirochaetales bacterium]|nr:diguanylate cyclase [Spirochaetales bacterium]
MSQTRSHEMTSHGIAVGIMGSVAVYAGICHLIFFIFSKKEKDNLNFAFVSLSVAAYNFFCAFFYNATSIKEAIWLQRGQFSTIALMSLSFLFFIIKKTRKKMSIHDYIFFIINFAFIFLPWINHPLFLDSENPAVKAINILGNPIVYYESEPGILLILELLTVFIQVAFFISYCIRYYMKIKDSEMLIFAIGFSFFGIVASLDILTASGLMKMIYLTEYGFFSLILIMDYSLVIEFVKAFHKDRKLNVQLEKMIRDSIKKIKELNQQLIEGNEDLENKNTTLKLLAEKDSLTGLLNHTTFQNRVNELASMANNHFFPITLAMIDVDNFKSINDNLGHQQGDKILTTIAEIFRSDLRTSDIKSRYTMNKKEETLQKTLRNYDTAARYGGDEFSIMLPYCDKEGAEIVINRIFEHIRKIRDDDNKSITVSCGICHTSPGDIIDASKLIKFADIALYKAKLAGKNTFTTVAYKDLIE